MNYIWYSKSTCVTGKKLKEALSVEGGTRPPPIGTTKCICWGARHPKRGYKRSTIRRINELIANHNMLNNVNCIEGNANKQTALRIMHEHDCPVPKLLPIVNGTVLLSDNDFPMVGRKNYHQGGSGFYYCTRAADMYGAVRNGVDYFIQFIPNDEEYRVQLFKGEVIRVSKKVQDREDADLLCRSNNKGWHFAHKQWRDRYEGLKVAATMALDALNLDFGGVDLVRDVNGKVWILEANSGVGLGESGVEKYSEKFREWLDG
jgi:carbamoylphosphate synthase large subunit